MSLQKNQGYIYIALQIDIFWVYFCPIVHIDYIRTRLVSLLRSRHSQAYREKSALVATKWSRILCSVEEPRKEGRNFWHAFSALSPFSSLWRVA